MNERQRLARAAAEEPADDGPRLALGDWLEEHGEEARGTFVRTGVELARMDEADDPSRLRASSLLVAMCRAFGSAERRGFQSQRDGGVHSDS